MNIHLGDVKYANRVTDDTQTKNSLPLLQSWKAVLDDITGCIEEGRGTSGPENKHHKEKKGRKKLWHELNSRKRVRIRDEG